MRLSSLDAALLDTRPPASLAALPRPLLELAYFTVKEARACLRTDARAPGMTIVRLGSARGPG